MNPNEARSAFPSVSEPAVHYAKSVICPECGHHIPLGVEGMDWLVRGPNDIATRLLATVGRAEREELVVVLLNTKNRVIHCEQVYRGNVSSSVVKVGELFTEAIRRRAAGLVLVHSHPSGDATPSPDDLSLTSAVIAAGKLLDVPVLDHLVLGHDTWVSMRDRGIAFNR